MLTSRREYNDAVISTTRRNFLKTGAGASLAVSASTVLAQSPASAGKPNAADANLGKSTLPRVVVHQDGHFLCGADGSPFFWLGDTAWQLIQQTTRDECSYYLHARASQGFTVIQTVVLAEFEGVAAPTALSLTPFVNQDPTRPTKSFSIAWSKSWTKRRSEASMLPCYPPGETS